MVVDQNTKGKEVEKLKMLDLCANTITPEYMVAVWSDPDMKTVELMQLAETDLVDKEEVFNILRMNILGVLISFVCLNNSDVDDLISYLKFLAITNLS